jgi:hypothetical protein
MTGNNDTGESLMPVSLTPVNSLLLVSKHKVADIREFFVKIQNCPNEILRGPGKNNHEKPEVTLKVLSSEMDPTEIRLIR